ncbi:hypothetical protein UPF0755 [Gottschalkia acidurici 9a]|uniref:YceG-like family protein n=1 Tax=Gottschalkia acidurici (strain ATCC 7906 / DSM 604 / BCRC 14475 / CIP 104303 / KCTC 5404 / NCIMB 10678 / 9a) TaxID=1128398 RepID=K0B0T9_GOTA9|nr:hypothetical protein [Gottschalkia acidurici]AFS78261.1 hypothetical protein UPF0755 [Gottschalkia acidurici 9a]
MSKNKIYYLILGLGLGIVLTSSINIAFNKPKQIEYSEQEIIEKARGLGMISVKENIEANSKKDQDKNNKEANKEDDIEEVSNKVEIDQESNNQVNNQPIKTKTSQTQAKGQAKTQSNTKPKEQKVQQKENVDSQPKYATINIGNGDTATSIVSRLKEANIIQDEEDFMRVLKENELQGKFITGSHQVKVNGTYDEILKSLIKEKDIKNMSTE